MSEHDEHILALLSEVEDPEVPVLSIVDLGIVRATSASAGEARVTITPTYSGCPAMQAIEQAIREKLSAHGYQRVVIETVLSPPWTTEWMSDAGKEKLRRYGIAPPAAGEAEQFLPFTALTEKIPCPRCSSLNTEVTSAFGATACKALCVCRECKEPFEYFKPF